MGISAESVAHE